MCGRWLVGIVLLVVWCPGPSCVGGERLSREQAASALRRAVGFFREEVSAEGGYLWRYSADLSRMEGEGRAGPTTAWVQPPGTPTVGDAYLTAFQRTADDYLLEAARETAQALVKGQLESGGWDYRIEFAAKDRRRYSYRLPPRNPDGRNTTTLDDDVTQSALRFLMRVDETLDFQEATIHEAVGYALSCLLKAQYPNGAWPQRFSEFPDPEQYPVKKANYPESWPREHPDKNYRGYYTFNDNTIADMIETMFLAAEIYGNDRYRQSAEQAGDFILLAQMPDPQPAWAQQYNRDMQPAWARRFEPPAVTGGESQGVMRSLLELYRETGKKKYLEPIPRALKYLKNSRLPDGRLARFYELKTNRPLYFVRDTYELTYSSDNLPTHYAFIVGSRLERIDAEYKRLLKTNPDDLKPAATEPRFRMTDRLASETKAIVDALDDRGAWVEPGALRRADDPDDPTKRIISSRTFAENVELLSRFLAASD